MKKQQLTHNPGYISSIIFLFRVHFTFSIYFEILKNIDNWGIQFTSVTCSYIIQASGVVCKEKKTRSVTVNTLLIIAFEMSDNSNYNLK